MKISSVSPREDIVWTMSLPSSGWKVIGWLSPDTRRERVGKDAMCTWTWGRVRSSRARARMVFACPVSAFVKKRIFLTEEPASLAVILSGYLGLPVGATAGFWDVQAGRGAGRAKPSAPVLPNE